MNEEYCLLYKPWIKVLNYENVIKEVSLLDVFKNAHQYKRLSGETVTQDAAIYRLLLSIVITVFYRYDSDGQKEDVLDCLDPVEIILERWFSYWERGSFDAEAFQKYLETYRERFYLFHPQTPFWQVANLKEGTNYGIINLYGNIKESNNKASRHHFHVTDGKYVENISYAEAARWLVYNNAYSINVKTKVDGKSKATGVGWLGQLGLIMVKGDSLYKSLLLNLCPLDNNGNAWAEPKPIWEQEPRVDPGIEIPPADNLPELYTLQSRRLLLLRNDDKIEGYRSIGGDYYSSTDNLVEPMTLLKRDENEDPKPQRHKKEVAGWREFPSLLVSRGQGNLKPGLLRWLETLKELHFDAGDIMTFQMVGLEYGDGMSYTNGELINNYLSMSKELIKEKGEEWRTLITNEIANCEKVAQNSFYVFAKTLVFEMFPGNDDKIKNANVKNLKDKLSSAYYYKIDQSFREWLISIEPGISIQEKKEWEWQKISARIANDVVFEYVSGMAPQYTMACARAFGLFKSVLCRIYSKGKKDGREKRE